MNGNMPSGSERFDLSGKSFLFVLRQILTSKVECVGLFQCGQNALCSKTQALSRFARRKFDFEERLMRIAGYPGLAEHIDAHRRFIARLERGPVRPGCDEWMRWLQDLADDWALEHLISHDCTFGAWADIQPT